MTLLPTVNVGYQPSRNLPGEDTPKASEQCIVLIGAPFGRIPLFRFQDDYLFHDIAGLNGFYHLHITGSPKHCVNAVQMRLG
jgi:hypothetical protein